MLTLLRPSFFKKCVKIFSFSLQTDYGCPLLNKNNELIGIVSHVLILGVRPISFVRINEVAVLINAWKVYLMNVRERKVSKRRKIL